MSATGDERQPLLKPDADSSDVLINSRSAEEGKQASESCCIVFLLLSYWSNFGTGLCLVLVLLNTFNFGVRGIASKLTRGPAGDLPKLSQIKT